MYFSSVYPWYIRLLMLPFCILKAVHSKDDTAETKLFSHNDLSDKDESLKQMLTESLIKYHIAKDRLLIF